MKLMDIKNGIGPEWAEKGYQMPQFDIEAVRKKTHEEPVWVHFGAGNLFRAFPAAILQQALDSGKYDRGVIVAEGFDFEIIHKAYAPYDNLSLLVCLQSDGNIQKKVIASVTESLKADAQFEADWARLAEIFQNPSLQMISFTITEKGYSLVDGTGRYLPAVEADFKGGPDAPSSYMGKVAALLYTRYQAGQKPIAMVSTDNCSHNGDKLYAAISTFAGKWVENGRAEEGFLRYVDDRNKVTYPWTMIDKITPRPDPSVEKILLEDGVEGLEPVITSRNTYVAPFVNAEECEYLVVEDAFPNGRPALEKGGVIFTDRETVDKVEKMKVCTCLNPLHTALAVYGCLLGYQKISEEMQDEELVKLVQRIGYTEGLPVVVDPGILAPREFIDTVLTVRVPNPFMPDTPQRIATDTSQKLAIRFGETIKAYQKRSDLDPADLKLIPLVFAGWLRYLMAVDDQGKPFTPSSDPLLQAATAYVADYRLDASPKDLSRLDPLLSNEKVFGVDLKEVHMDELVKEYFAELSAGVGAVTATLEKYVK